MSNALNAIRDRIRELKERAVPNATLGVYLNDTNWNRLLADQDLIDTMYRAGALRNIVEIHAVRIDNVVVKPITEIKCG